MSERFISPFHGGIAVNYSGNVVNVKNPNLEFHHDSCSIKCGLREELDRYFRGSRSQMDLTAEEKVKICLSLSEECIKPDELLSLLQKKDYTPLAYDGFEPSGRMHIAQGLCKVDTVNIMSKIGIKSVIWIADWHAMLNNKFGGDLKKIRIVGEYFIHIWKAAGMNPDSVKFLWASDEVDKNPDLYWRLSMDISRSFNITRMKRCSQALGRTEGDDQPSAQLLYPAIQCADIFFIGADICQLGMDQRKINVLAREYSELRKIPRSPVVLSHRMLPGLVEGQEKMSKSNPNSAIFMDDSAEEVSSKIKKAFCPPGVVDGNPVIAYFCFIVFKRFNSVTIERKEKDGGDVTFNSPEELKDAFLKGSLHPADVKNALVKYLNLMMQPIRDYFEVILTFILISLAQS
ncbi:tyrosyl-tRNA synthetase, putative [Theileria annulata]|uniref:tyrosine--tRNA ligase n=1 Tax=Theileria annulata TaxID=5874 RepID=Q4U9U4_THEAN|nr:tyrosyl-tRNA synthetase, putative [Theileria annulata]CAI76409.1 tyrosyl-tRNA synthetase, putative [Theileria annulata]|eukprot:XP_953034.1 tyrosyl-tRNA synthetase, putative [Theileria annulata]